MQNNHTQQQSVQQDAISQANLAQMMAKTNILLQNQQIQQQQQQQQFSLQNQFAAMQAAQAQLGNPVNAGNQLALFKPNPNMFMYQPQMVQQDSITQQPPPPQPHAQTSTSEANPVVLTKLEVITEKLDQIRSVTTSLTQNNLPNMETSVILHNIQRIVKENEQYKKDLYEKGNKIEEQNQKITELLMKAQNYVEQSHQILELKNNSFQSNAERNQQRVLELEQDKMHLTSELSKTTSQISELNLEVNRMKKADAEIRQHLSDVSKSTDQYKQDSERLVVESADLQAKFDVAVNEVKKEKQLRRNAEAKLQTCEDELNECKVNLSNSQKAVEEKKKKLEQDRVLFDDEIDELKKFHLNEVE